MKRVLLFLWLNSIILSISFAQHSLYISLHAGKYFFPVEKGFAIGTRYNPYLMVPINHNDFDFELMCYCSKITRLLSKQVRIGYSVNQQTTIGLLYNFDKVYLAMPCSYTLEHLSYISGIFLGKTSNLNKSGTLQILQSFEILYRHGISKIYEYVPLVTWNDIDTCWQVNPKPAPDLRVTALGMGYSASIHLLIWKSIYATMSGHISLFFLGKNAGFQPLQFRLMFGLAWKPQIPRKQEK